MSQQRRRQAITIVVALAIALVGGVPRRVLRRRRY
jgi:hypothetical protein